MAISEPYNAHFAPKMGVVRFRLLPQNRSGITIIPYGVFPNCLETKLLLDAFRKSPDSNSYAF